MPDPLSKVPSRITVEDLLRLKRAERPPLQFWTEFERELRQKQLAALVERKPWWHELGAFPGRFSWLRVPVGATAVLALTLLSVRQYSYSSGRSLVVPERKAASLSPTLPVSAAYRPVENPRAASSAHVAVAEEHTVTKSLKSNDPVPETRQVTPREIAGLVSRIGESDFVVIPSEHEALSGSIAIQLATAGPVEPALVDATARTIGFEDRSISTPRPRRTAELLPTAVAMTEQRRTRLLAALGSAGTYAPEPSAPERARRSVIRYLAEDGWDRSMSRLQADGDRLSIRF
jgi:hypothetical protein